MTTEAAIKSKLKGIDRDWDQKCQALAWNLCNWFGHAGRTYASANDAYHASEIVSKDATKAPAGSFHYWSIGRYGHVALGLGGTRVLMASAKIDTAWGTHVGVTTVPRYGARSGAKYLGWSRTNGVGTVRIDIPTPAKTSDKASVKKVANFLNGQKLGHRTTASDDGVRGKVYWLLVQLYAKAHLGYKGLLDGIPGVQSKAAEKKILSKA